tara:strand:+ start:370 stop:558 length:189 start_codon:yes stop_codon:yes gene_type:complete
MPNTKKVATDAQSEFHFSPQHEAQIREAFIALDKEHGIDRIAVQVSWEKMKARLLKLDQKGG